MCMSLSHSLSHQTHIKPTHQTPAHLPTARKNFSRRRAAYEGEDVTSINERNKHFNKKLKRAFDKYTVEIRQNLERGTAL